MMKYSKYSDFLMQTLFTILALYFTCLLLCYPAQALTYASTGLLLWFQKMIPTLLPFMILSGLMIRMNLTEQFSKWVHPLFHRIFGTSRNGSYVLIMGMLCGFPMGARIIGELLRADKITEKEASYLLAFTNNIGPIYFISFVMSSLSIEKNYFPFFIMYSVPLLYGFLLRLIKYKKQYFPPVLHPTGSQSSSAEPFFAALDNAIVSGLIGIAKLGGYMVFFNLLNLLFYPLSNLSKVFLALCNGILEITSGISRICSNDTYGAYAVLILLPFGGLSCIAQTYSMIKDTSLSRSSYLLHKILQMLMTALIYVFYAVFFCGGVYSL